MLIGIDIGAHAARAAALGPDGRPYLIPDAYGNRIMPAVARYTMHGVEVGDYPARFLVCNWENSVRGCTRYLARYADLPPQALAAAPFGVYDEDGQVLLDLLYARATPQEVFGHLLAALCRRAEAHLGAPVDEVVLTVPASAEDRYRVLVRAAAEAQGLRVRRLLNQPTAALLAYRALAAGRTLPEGAPVAVVDVGGGATDVSIATLDGATVRVLATAGDGFLGGHDLAWRAAAGLAERLQPQTGRDLLADEGGSRVAALGLFHAAEEALERLALLPSTPVALDHGAGFGRDLFTVVRREQAEAWLGPDLERIGALCRRALEAAGLRAAQVGAVLLVGGGSGLPGVRAAVAAAFERLPGDLERREPLALAAYGAALAGSAPDGLVWDVTPFPLGINCYYGEEELFSPIIAANTPIPTPGMGRPGAHSDAYQTRFPDQTTVRLDILQYRGPKRPATRGPNKVYPHECEKLGSWSFAGLRPPPGGYAPFTVTFAIDADGILHLLAEETATGHRLTAQVQRW